MTRIVQSTPEMIQYAATMILGGEVVAFPTETVYGLGADATNTAAVAKIYAAKNRPAFNPLILHIAHIDQAHEIAEMDARAHDVASALWPGPITLVLRLKSRAISSLATAGLETVTLRIPAHPVARALLEAVGRPVAAPSANPSGTLSPTNACHVARTLDGKVPLVLAGGASSWGIESTILDLTSAIPKILRLGAIDADELMPLIGKAEIVDRAEAIKAPGQLHRHYATQTPLRLNAVDVKAGEALLAFGKTQFIGVEGVGFVRDMEDKRMRNLSPKGDLFEAATNLYAHLHELDAAGASAIAVMAIPQKGLGLAINDRLSRAAVPEGEQNRPLE